jgi:arylsulfatase A-like enzyme
MKRLTVLIACVTFLKILVYADTLQVLRNHQSIPLISENVLKSSSPKNGKTTVFNGGLFYTPKANYVGKDSLRVTLADMSTHSISIDVRAYPNFVFLLTDDQSWTGLSVRMDKNSPESASDFHRTPYIERIAAQGMRFSRGYSPAPNCSPTRYANLTGKTTARLKFTDIVGRNQNVPDEGKFRLSAIRTATKEIEEEETTLPELLKSLPGAGYSTAHIGKWHLLGGGPEKHGFDVSDGATGNREGSFPKNIVANDPKLAYGIAERGNGFMDDAVKAGQPFYCQLSHYAVHAGIQYSEDALAETETWDVGKNHVSMEYAAMVVDLDNSVGQTLAHIDALGLRHSTYVIYQADNGAPQFLSNAFPLKRFKPEIWEGGNRVPTLVCGPGIPKNSQCDQAMMGIDILPTIWDLAGGDKSRLHEDIDGTSIATWLKGDTKGSIQRSSPLVLHSPHYVVDSNQRKNQRPSSALHDGSWKLVAWYETGLIHLYNLDEDPAEAHDLAGEFPKEALRLRKQLRDYFSDVGAQLPTLDASHIDNLGKPGDADADGLPDEWEFAQLLTHVLGPDDDPDGDGKSNLTELRSHTDPLSW